MTENRKEKSRAGCDSWVKGVMGLKVSRNKAAMHMYTWHPEQTPVNPRILLIYNIPYEVSCNLTRGVRGLPKKTHIMKHGLK